VHYYKRNIGDYHRKAGRLSILQHGTYTLLMDACYDREQFPTHDEALDWVWASSNDEIEAVAFVLKKFFTETDGVFIQSRVKEELDRYQANAAINKRIAMEREAKRKGNSTKRTQTVNEAPPNQEPLTTNQEPTKGGETMEQKEAMRSVIEYLNEKSSKNFKGTDSNLKFIRARLGQGYTIDDMKAVVDRKAAEWSDTNMAQYLRPSTLFNDEKFNQYVGELGSPMPEKEIILPDWAKMPKGDDQLTMWARKYGYGEAIGNESADQFRQRLQRKIDERMNDE
jgi:uncharacterized phage protein (TIGR02220 family)